MELAIVLPILLLLVGGGLDLGRAFYARVQVENASKEGALYGAGTPQCATSGSGCSDPNNVAWHVDQELSGLANTTTSTQCLHAGSPVSPASCAEGDTYQVSVTHTFSLVTPILSQVVGSNVVMHSTSTALVLNEAPSGGPVIIPPPPSCLVVPDLVGSTVGAARAAWTGAGFGAGTFTPANGLTNKTVLGQTTNPSSSPGDCITSSATVSVTHT